MVPFGKVPFGLVPFGLVPFGLVPFGLVPFGMVPFSQIFGPFWLGPFWPVPFGQSLMAWSLMTSNAVNGFDCWQVSQWVLSWTWCISQNNSGTQNQSFAYYKPSLICTCISITHDELSNKEIAYDQWCWWPLFTLCTYLDQLDIWTILWLGQKSP